MTMAQEEAPATAAEEPQKRPGSALTDEPGPAKVRKANQESKLQKNAGKPRCTYGEKCYRKNPSHLRDYWHPPRDRE